MERTTGSGHGVMAIKTMREFRDALSRLHVLERADPRSAERKALEIAVSRYLAAVGGDEPKASDVHS